jgi:hyperosmotically inducible protein
MKKALILVSILLAGATLQGCVVAAVGGAAAGGYYVGKDDRSAEQLAKDAALTAEVKSLLIAEPGIRAFDINVDTYNSTVALKGTVKSGAQRALAERVARKARGVKAVHNELKTR